MNLQICKSANLQTSKPANDPTFQPSTLPAIQPPNLPLLARWLLLAGLVLAAAGASFAPWVDRPPAALILTAPDLAEFCKFLPEVRDGSLHVHRLLFLFPLFLASLTLPLVVQSRRLAYPRWMRWPALAVVLPLALSLLPPVWSPGVLLSPEFRPQTAACLFCLGLVALSRWLRWVPTRPLLAILIPLSAAAPVLALWQFFVARPAMARAYAGPITPGWGSWATGVGFLLVIMSAALTWASLRRQPTLDTGRAMESAAT